MAGIKPLGEMKIKFFFYLLQHNQTKLMQKGTGTTFTAIRRKEIHELKVLLPTINEQKRIVSKIESIFVQINILEEALKSVKSRMAQYRQAVLKMAFEGKLVPQDPNDEPADKLLERIQGAIYEHVDVSKKSETLSEYETLTSPKGWILVKIGYVCKLFGGGTPSRKNFSYFNGDIVWLTPTEIPKNNIQKIYNSREKITKLGLEKSSAKIIPADSVLLTSRASIGYVAIAGTTVSTNQGFASFYCNDAVFNYYLAYWLWNKKDFLKHVATGTTFKEISKSRLREIEIPLPPLNEQKQMVSKIEVIFAQIETIERHTTVQLQRLKTLRNSILKQAFEGRLVPQDPNDEPASKLLERIRSAKHDQ